MTHLLFGEYQKVPLAALQAPQNLYLGAGDEARTRYLHLGKVALYRMSYARTPGFASGLVVVTGHQNYITFLRRVKFLPVFFAGFFHYFPNQYINIMLPNSL